MRLRVQRGAARPWWHAGFGGAEGPLWAAARGLWERPQFLGFLHRASARGEPNPRGTRWLGGQTLSPVCAFPLDPCGRAAVL